MIVGWSMDETMESRLVVDALDMAVRRRLPGGGWWPTRTGAASTPATTTSGCWRARDHVQHERGRPVLGQRPGGVVLRPAEVRAGPDEVFATRDQARAAIFEYLEVFYNRVRRTRRLDATSNSSAAWLFDSMVQTPQGFGAGSGPVHRG